MSVGSTEANLTSPTTSSPLANSEGPTKWASIFVASLATYAVIRGIRGATATPFWFDEFFTLKIASQHSLRDMWTIVQRAYETQPPLFYLIERMALALPAKKEVALRLPSILAFPCVLLCVFAYARKAGSELTACVCAFLLFSTSLFHTYLIDARPYALAVACIAFALVCYQRIPSPRWTLLFATSLVLAESLHYLAVLGMAPLALAEGVLFLRTRRFRWQVWLALLFGFLPLIPALPLLSKSKALYGPHLFSRPVFSRVVQYYGAFFVTDRESGLALFTVCVAAVVWWMVRGEIRASGGSEESRSNLVEGSLLLGLILLPFVTFVVVRVAHAGLLDRYVLISTIGIILGINCALSLIESRAAVLLLALFVFMSVGLHEERFWRQSGYDPLSDNISARSTDEFASVQKLIQSSGHLNLPVVFDQAPLYFQLVNYAPPDWTKRLVYLTDEEKDLAFNGDDTTVRVLKAISSDFPVQLDDYTEFTRTHSEFLVYSEPEAWILYEMRRQGAFVQVLQRVGSRAVYLVKMRESFYP